MKSLSLFFALVIALISNVSYAGGTETGLVFDVRVSSKLSFNPTHFSVVGTITGAPACATNGYWAIDTGTAMGQAMLSTLLSAKSNGNTVTIWGAGTCNLRSDMEDAVQISIN